MSFNVAVRNQVSVNISPEIQFNKHAIHDITAVVVKTGYMHKRLEEKLWLANIFVIPFIVYPIISIIGHAIIEANYGKEHRAYGKIAHYLDEKYSTLQNHAFTLTDTDMNYMNDIFKKYKLKGFLPTAVEETLMNGKENVFDFGINRSSY